MAKITRTHPQPFGVYNSSFNQSSDMDMDVAVFCLHLYQQVEGINITYQSAADGGVIGKEMGR